MAERKYSIDEIEQMRKAISWSFAGGSHRSAERCAEIEEQLRTHMLNGTDPEELEAWGLERMGENIRRDKDDQAIWQEPSHSAST